MNLGRKKWDDLHEQRVLALGWDEDTVENPVLIEIIDKVQLVEETVKMA